MKAPSFPARWRQKFTRTAHGLSLDGLSPVAVAVGLVLCEYADWDTGGGIRPGRRRVALVVGCSEATVTRAVSALAAAGWLSIDERGSFGRASTYRLTIPPLVTPSTGEVSAPLTGAPVSPLGRPVTGSPVSRSETVARILNGLTRAPSTGSPVSHHLCQTFVAGVPNLGAVA